MGGICYGTTNKSEKLSPKKQDQLERINEKKGSIASSNNHENKKIDKKLNNEPNEDQNPIEKNHNFKEKLETDENHRKNQKKQKVNENIFSSKEREVLQFVKDNNNLEDQNKIEEAFNKHFFMRNLTKEVRKKIMTQMKIYSVNKGVEIFKQGNLGMFFYIIKSGEVEIFIDNVYKKTLKNNDSFGELALLHGAPRSASVKAKVDTFLYALDRKDFRNIINQVNSLNFEENKNFIPHIPMLSNIDDDMKTALCSGLNKEIYDKGSVIVKCGEIASCMYIIKEGEVDCVSQGKVIRTLSKGDFFGEKSILLETVRTLDVIAKTNCVCLSISVETLKNMFGNKFKELIYLNIIKTSFLNSKFLKNFEFTLIENNFDIFKTRNLLKGDVVCRAGSNLSEKMMFVIEGDAENEETKQIYSRGNLLFEKDIVEGTNKSLDANYHANPDCLICECDVSSFLELIGAKNFEELFIINKVFKSLQKISLLRYLSVSKLKSLSKIVKISKFSKNYRFFNQDDDSNDIYIIVSGSVKEVLNNNEKIEKIYNSGEIFGEYSLFFKEKRKFNAIAFEDCECIKLTKEDLSKVIDSKLFEFMKTRFYLLDKSIQLEDLDYVSSLGSGNFGEVSLVYCKKNKIKYAIKAMSKEQIIKENIWLNLQAEKTVLQLSDHPFIVKLVKTLKDNVNLFLLMEYARGKELFDVIRDIGLLNRPTTQFYIASMMLAVNYLHEKKYIYRDIKPENIIVVEKGFLKLIDFGTSKLIADRTSTIIGTPHYMAPEIILGEGYSFQVDFWSIAICMYEFVVGGVPFGETADDPIAIYKAIINDNLSFPSKIVKDSEFKKIVTDMLNKNPLNRLFKLYLIKDTDYFRRFDWEGLANLDIEIPYMPNFDFKDNVEPKISYLNYLKDLKSYKAAKGLNSPTQKTREVEKFFSEF